MHLRYVFAVCNNCCSECVYGVEYIRAIIAFVAILVSVVGTLPHMGTHPAPAPLSWHDIEKISDHCQGCNDSIFFSLHWSSRWYRHEYPLNRFSSVKMVIWVKIWISLILREVGFNGIVNKNLNLPTKCHSYFDLWFHSYLLVLIELKHICKARWA